MPVEDGHGHETFLMHAWTASFCQPVLERPGFFSALVAVQDDQDSVLDCECCAPFL